MSVTIYHNPRCGKSREGLKLVEEKGVDFETRLYMTDQFNSQELKEVINKLGIPAEGLIRKKESIYKEEYANKELSENDCIEAMLKHPKLIERPIVINGSKAIIGRPPSLINDIF